MIGLFGKEGVVTCSLSYSLSMILVLCALHPHASPHCAAEMPQLFLEHSDMNLTRLAGQSAGAACWFAVSWDLNAAHLKHEEVNVCKGIAL